MRRFSPTGVDLGNFASTGLNEPAFLAFSPVPELGSLVLFRLGGLGLLGYVCWRC